MSHLVPRQIIDSLGRRSIRMTRPDREGVRRLKATEVPPSAATEDPEMTRRSLLALAHTIDVSARTRKAARDSARRRLPHLDQAEFSRRWDAIERAALLSAKYGSDDALEDGSLPPEDEVPSHLDLDDYKQINPADRAGETDYVGYDLDSYASDISEYWHSEFGRLIQEAVEADIQSR